MFIDMHSMSMGGGDRKQDAIPSLLLYLSSPN